MTYVPEKLRQRVIARANRYCEYCRAFQDIIVEMEIDHILPISQGGKTVLDNLCLACSRCNNAKSDFTTSVDPQSNLEVVLFNPRQQQWNDHFRWSADGTEIVGLTPTGRATVDRLKTNRELAVLARRLWVKAGWHPPKI